MKFLTISLVAIATLFSISVNAACPPAGELVLNNQNEVDDFFTDYPGCTMLPADVELTIRGGGITNLDGLNGIVSIAGTLNIKGCPNLTDITGLSSLTSAGQIDFEDCTSLASLDGLDNLTTMSDDLEFTGMDALTDISQLSGLSSIGGELYIKDCDALVSLTGLEGITSIGGSLTLEQSHKLTDLTALSALTSIGGSVSIMSNATLASLDGLENVASIGGGIDIKHNQSLSDCIGVCLMRSLVPPGNVFISSNITGQPLNHCNNSAVLDADCLIALPVELSDFRAKEDKKNATVVLSWTTASELNNKQFEVERATDGRTFKTIGIVAGNGTTTKTHNYKFVDAQPVATAYYRLKQVDFAGDFVFSDLVLVEMSKAETAQVEAYPTIANNEITVRFKGFEAQNGTFNVFDAQGRMVYSEQVDLSNKMAYKSLNTTKFHPGIYTIVITDNSNIISTNFVVVK